MASLILGLTLPPAPMHDTDRGMKHVAIYPLRVLTNTPSTANNQMANQPPAPEFMDIFTILEQLYVNWRWR